MELAIVIYHLCAECHKLVDSSDMNAPATCVYCANNRRLDDRFPFLCAICSMVAV